MDANFRTDASSRTPNSSSASVSDKANRLIAQNRSNSGSLNIDGLISTIKADSNKGTPPNELIAQVDIALESSAHPFDLARFRDEFKSELNYKDTNTYHGRPISVGSAIDSTQQLRQYANDALFTYKNPSGVTEITNEFAFIEPPASQQTNTVTADSSPRKSKPEKDACDKPYRKMATIELNASSGRKLMNVDPPTAKLHIHDASSKSEAKFDIGEKGKFGDVAVQLTGYAENTVDEGSVHLDEKGSMVTSYGISGKSGLGLASIENEAKTANASFNVVETEFEAKTSAHLDASSSRYIGTQTSAEVKLNLLKLDASNSSTIDLDPISMRLKVSGELQAGPAIKVEVSTGELASKGAINVDPSILRGNVKLEIEAKNANCD